MAKKQVDRDEWGGYVKQLATHLESKYGARNAYLADVRNRRFMRHKPKVPAQYQQTAATYQSPLIFDLCRKAGAMIGTQMPEPRVRPIKEGSRAQEASSLQEAWYAAAYRRMDEGKSEYLKHIDACIADSASVLHIRLDKHKWAGKTEKGVTSLAKGEDEKDEEYIGRVEEHHRANFPFDWQQIPIETFYPTYDADGRLVEVVLRGERDAYPVASKYGLKKEGGKWVKEGKRVGPISPEGRSGNVKFTEYWNAELMLRMLDDDVVEAKFHNYGRPPFFETRAVVTSSRDVVEEVMGLPAPLVGLQDTTDSLGTMFLNWILMTAFPTPVLRPIPGEQYVKPGNDEKLVWDIGKLITPPEGTTFEWMTLPALSGDLKEFFNILAATSKEVGLATILSGEMPQGDVSGPAVTTMLAVAKSIFGTLVANLCKSFDEMAMFMAERIEQDIHEPVPVWERASNKDTKAARWIEMGPKDIKGHYVVEHSMKYVLPAEKWQRTLGLASLKNQNVPVPDEKILGEEGLGISDPETWMDMWEVQEMAKAPEIRQVKVQLAIQQLMGGPGANVKPRESLGSPPQPAAGPGGAFMPQMPGVQTGIVPGAPNAAPPPQPNPAGVPPEAIM